MNTLPPLPAALEQIPTNLREHLWRGDALVKVQRSVASGFAALDQELPGHGWPTHGLTEILLASPGIGELRLLMPGLAAVVQAQRPILLLTPGPLVHCQACPDGLRHLGIAPHQLMHIDVPRIEDRLWVIEQSLKSAACAAVLAWLPEVRADALRRLQVAAANNNGLCFVFRPTCARHDASPATLRLLLEPGSAMSQQRALAVHLIKRRGPLLERALCLDVGTPRPLRIRPGISRPVSPKPVVHPLPTDHAVVRSSLSAAGNRLHRTPYA